MLYLTILYDQLLAINSPWHPSQNFPFVILNDEVLGFGSVLFVPEI